MEIYWDSSALFTDEEDLHFKLDVTGKELLAIFQTFIEVTTDSTHTRDDIYACLDKYIEGDLVLQDMMKKKNRF